MKALAIGLLGVAVTLLLQAQSARTPKVPVDMIFINGDIYPGVPLAPGSKASGGVRAQALAVANGRIVQVGTSEEILKLKTSRTQVVDLGGHFVMPGFNDAHLHLANGGFEKLNVDLVGTKSLDEMKRRIAERARTTTRGEWIVGRGWDHTLWSSLQLPSRSDLDAVTGEHPAFFVRVDGHIGVANSAALKAAGITRETADPAAGKIDRDKSGEPTGIVRESALSLVNSKIPRPTPAQRRRAAELALQDAARHGLTSVQDNSEWEDFLVYEEMEREGKLMLRISEWLPFESPLELLEKHRARHEQKDPLLHTGMLKGFMDGSLGSRTAALLAAYSDDPGNLGLPQYQQAQLNKMATERIAARFQMGFHAIGDRAAEMALQAFSEAERYAREHNVQGLGNDKEHEFRFRIEHAQVVAPNQFRRFHDMKIIASVQPNHLLTDMNWALSRIGPERAKSSYPWAEFLKNGVMLAFGTDYPVEPLTPFRGIYVAVTRKNEAGTKEYYPEQKITTEQAIAAYTTGAAYAEFAEQDKGVLEPGKLADFVVLDRDITKISPREILGTKVLRTVVGGKTVYDAK